MKSLDVVTTALRRPELLDYTYTSFFNRINNLPPLRIIINIDPLGSGDTKKCVSIAERFASEIVVRTPKTPNFSSAINWAWANLQSEIYLHLEDDWFLNRTIDFEDWSREFVSSDYDQSVLVMKRPRTSNSLNFSFRPNLTRTNSVHSIMPIPAHQNPEKFAANHQVSLRSIDYSKAIARTIDDMGRKWAKGNGLRRDCQPEGAWFQSRKVSFLDQFDARFSLLVWKLKVGMLGR
jgi:hypothetical protein